MTRDDIIRMAHEARIQELPKLESEFQKFERFAQLVAAAEREACEKEVWPQDIKVWSEEELTVIGKAFITAQEKHGWYETLMAVGTSILKMKAAAIRARGQQ